MPCPAEDSGESSEDELESEQQTSDAESGSVQADSEQQSGEAASDSNAEADEAGPSHGNAEPQQQRSTPGGHGQKRKQAGNSASKKRAKISITLGKGGGAQGYLVCHVSVVALWLYQCSFQPVNHAELAALLSSEHCILQCRCVASLGTMQASRALCMWTASTSPASCVEVSCPL